MPFPDLNAEDRKQHPLHSDVSRSPSWAGWTDCYFGHALWYAQSDNWRLHRFYLSEPLWRPTESPQSESRDWTNHPRLQRGGIEACRRGSAIASIASTLLRSQSAAYVLHADVWSRVQSQGDPNNYGTRRDQYDSGYLYTYHIGHPQKFGTKHECKNQTFRIRKTGMHRASVHSSFILCYIEFRKCVKNVSDWEFNTF